MKRWHKWFRWILPALGVAGIGSFIYWRSNLIEFPLRGGWKIRVLGFTHGTFHVAPGWSRTAAHFSPKILELFSKARLTALLPATTTSFTPSTLLWFRLIPPHSAATGAPPFEVSLGDGQSNWVSVTSVPNTPTPGQPFIRSAVFRTAPFHRERWMVRVDSGIMGSPEFHHHNCRGITPMVRNKSPRPTEIHPPITVSNHPVFISATDTTPRFSGSRVSLTLPPQIARRTIQSFTLMDVSGNSFSPSSHTMSSTDSGRVVHLDIIPGFWPDADAALDVVTLPTLSEPPDAIVTITNVPVPDGSWKLLSIPNSLSPFPGGRLGVQSVMKTSFLNVSNAIRMDVFVRFFGDVPSITFLGATQQGRTISRIGPNKPLIAGRSENLGTGFASQGNISFDARDIRPGHLSITFGIHSPRRDRFPIGRVLTVTPSSPEETRR